ncbi:MAG: PASTA domain-containing protein, partial [Gammaproteobacteria bacterium]
PAATARASVSSRRGWAPYAVGASVLAVLLLGIALWIGGGKDGEQGIYPVKPVPPGEGPASPPSNAAPEMTAPAEDIKVPGLLSVQRGSTAQLLDSAGLELGTVSSREDTEKTPGTVLEQQPGAGTLVQPGTRVNIVVAAAPALEPQEQPAPALNLEMPSFIGLPARTARGQIAEAGLRVARWSQRPVTGSDQVDRVVSQQPAAGTAIEKGAGVEIEVGVQTTSPQVEVPAMVGLSMEEALSALEQAGLELGRRSRKASAREPGTILRQSVAAGTRVAPGSAVDLVYARRLRRAPDARTRP